MCVSYWQTTNGLFFEFSTHKCVHSCIFFQPVISRFIAPSIYSKRSPAVCFNYSSPILLLICSIDELRCHSGHVFLLLSGLRLQYRAALSDDQEVRVLPLYVVSFERNRRARFSPIIPCTCRLRFFSIQLLRCTRFQHYKCILFVCHDEYYRKQ